MVKATCRVKVSKLKTKIKLNKTNIRIGVGQSYRLKKTITTNGTKAPSVKWRSSNKRVVSVSSGGKVKGKRIGAAKVTSDDEGQNKGEGNLSCNSYSTGYKYYNDQTVCYLFCGSFDQAECIDQTKEGKH